MTASHVFLTRFNLPSSGPEGVIRAQRGWLSGRIQLFEQFTVPAVERQSRQCDAWLVYIDPMSPGWLVDRLHALADRTRLTLIARQSVSRSDLQGDIAAALAHADYDTLVTTNLDNDDALGRSFVERLLTVRPDPPRCAIYLANGLIFDGRSLYAHHDPCNAFCSVREGADAPLTCWAGWHNRLDRIMPTVVVETRPSWLQVIHGANVSNRVHGHLVDPHPHMHEFEPALRTARTPSRGEWVRDRLIWAPARSGRTAARATAKEVIVRLGGDTALDKTKHALALLKSRS